MIEMKKFAVPALLFGFLFGFPVTATNIIECYDCDASKEDAVVHAWGFTNIPNTAVSKPGQVATDIVTVVDLAQREVTTFEVKKIQLPGTPSRSIYGVRYTKIQTEPTIQTRMDAVVAADNVLKAAAKELIVPKHVIPNAWEFVNCAYCQTHLQTFLNNSMPGQIETVAQVVNHIAQTLGLVQTSLPNVFKLNLEAGGSVTFKLTLTNSPMELEVELKTVTDESGNIVPFNAASLKGLNLYINKLEQVHMINRYIWHYNLHLPIRTGRGTIIDCPRPDADSCPGCPGYKRGQ